MILIKILVLYQIVGKSKTLINYRQGKTMDAVGASGGNANSGVTITGDMELHPQTYATVSSSGITDLTITPRWWII